MLVGYFMEPSAELRISKSFFFIANDKNSSWSSLLRGWLSSLSDSLFSQLQSKLNEWNYLEINRIKSKSKLKLIKWSKIEIIWCTDKYLENQNTSDKGISQSYTSSITTAEGDADSDNAGYDLARLDIDKRVSIGRRLMQIPADILFKCVLNFV